MCCQKFVILSAEFLYRIWEETKREEDREKKELAKKETTEWMKRQNICFVVAKKFSQITYSLKLIKVAWAQLS